GDQGAGRARRSRTAESVHDPTRISAPRPNPGGIIGVPGLRAICVDPWDHPMSSDTGGSVTRWIVALRGGEADEAARRLWDRYFDRLVSLARARLRTAPRGPDDEEDAALSAFESLCRGVAQGRFGRLGNRDELWRLLATITARKAADRIER